MYRILILHLSELYGALTPNNLRAWSIVGESYVLRINTIIYISPPRARQSDQQLMLLRSQAHGVHRRTEEEEAAAVVAADQAPVARHASDKATKIAAAPAGRASWQRQLASASQPRQTGSCLVSPDVRASRVRGLFGTLINYC